MNKKARGRSPVTAGRRGPSVGLIAGVVVVLLFAGVVGFGIYRTQRHPSAPLVIPAGATASGVPLGRATAPTAIDVYLDFQCPICRAFEQRSGATLNQLVAAGRARVTYHPLGYLDRFSSTNYSSRASAASGCAADAGVYQVFLGLLFANQPPERSAGLPDDRLIALGRQAGADDRFAACVHDGRYAPWTAGLSDQASQAGIDSIPTVFVNGREIDSTDQALRAAVGAGAN